MVGDGAVGLLGVLAARQLGAERIIAMSRHADRQKLALDFGATDIVAERGDEGVARIKDLTHGLGAHSVIEAVGTQESMLQAINACRPGGHVGFVGVTHDATIGGMDLFMSLVHLHGGPAPVRRFLPEHLRAHRRTAPSSPARSSTSRSRSKTPPRATGPWTSAARSRPSSPSSKERPTPMEIIQTRPPPKGRPSGSADLGSGRLVVDLAHQVEELFEVIE